MYANRSLSAGHSSVQPRSTSRSGTSNSYPTDQTGYSQRPPTNYASISRPSTGRRSRATGSVFGGGETQQVICAVSEGRGISPTVGLAFMNISTGEASLSQICDNQFYSKSINKLRIFEPTEILIVSTSAPPNAKSKMYSVIAENIEGSKLISIDRKYWSETAGLDYIQQLSFMEDVEALKVAIEGNYFATCCFGAVLKYIEYCFEYCFAPHSLRISYQPSEGSMMIDLATIESLELIENRQNSKSKECLFGLLRHTTTPMGARLLRSSILQPSTQKETVLSLRYDAVQELTSKEELFFTARQALKSQLDIEKLLTKLIIFPKNPDIHYAEHSINNVLILKSFLQLTTAVYGSLLGARSDLLSLIRQLCHPEKTTPVLKMIQDVINDDVAYASKPLDLRNQRTYAVKSGVAGLLDVARTTYKEVTEDINRYIDQINEETNIQAELRFNKARRYYLRISDADIQDCQTPETFINRHRKRGFVECQTIYLCQLNQRLEDSHQEVILMSDKTVQQLLDRVRGTMYDLFKISEGIAMLDMLASFAHISIMNDYVRPELTEVIGIKAGRHPIHEKIHNEKFIPNDVYASDQARFQIITGCNMSGKSTYIRTIALIAVMAQIGCFVPANYASLRISNQLFARISVDDCSEANVSTFAAEMRETSYILRNIDKNSLVIIDELGRGTSTRDGLAIALSIAETLVDSGAFVWFATHFRELAQVLSERNGVVNLHLAVDINIPSAASVENSSLKMLYKIKDGPICEESYGITLARVLDLPASVLDTAEHVSNQLRQQALAKRKSSRALATARKRKLLLALREQLFAVRAGPLKGDAKWRWIEKLQKEFVLRMEAIERDVEEYEEYNDEEDNEQRERETDSEAEGQEVKIHEASEEIDTEI